MERESIKKLSNDLILSLDYSKGGEGLCFSVSFPLSILLHLHSIYNELIHFKFNFNDPPKKGDHFLIFLNDDYIIDSTYLQFSNSSVSTDETEKIFFERKSKFELIDKFYNSSVIDILNTKKIHFDIWHNRLIRFQTDPYPINDLRWIAINNIIICNNFLNILSSTLFDDEIRKLFNRPFWFYLDSIKETIEKWSSDEEFAIKTENKHIKILENINRIKHA